MIIYLHDSRSPYRRYQKFTAHKAASDLEHIVVAPVMSIPKIAQAVIKKAGKRNNIWLLVMLAHGNKGWLQLGQGLTAATASQFGALRPYMTPTGKGIEILGCAVASDTPVADNPFVGLCGTGRSSPTSGVNMLIALAKAVGCTVKGAIDAQAADTDGRYNGPYVMVKSNGTFDVREGDKVYWSR